jgi:predicted enzyme related to lactoylglutathione lyase
VLVFPVDNIDDAHEVLKSNGVKIVKTPHQVCETPTGIGYSVDFEDPDGNLLSVYAEKPKKKK